MKIKRQKRTTEDDLRDLLLNTIALTRQVRELYADYMDEMFGKTPVQHLPCDSCEEEER